jgi:hypothetical protein
MESEPKEPTKESQMFLNPELQLTIAHQRQRDLIADGETAGILSAARRRRTRRGAHRDTGTGRPVDSRAWHARAEAPA